MVEEASNNPTCLRGGDAVEGTLMLGMTAVRRGRWTIEDITSSLLIAGCGGMFRSFDGRTEAVAVRDGTGSWTIRWYCMVAMEVR